MRKIEQKCLEIGGLISQKVGDIFSFIFFENFYLAAATKLVLRTEALN